MILLSPYFWIALLLSWGVAFGSGYWKGGQSARTELALAAAKAKADRERTETAWAVNATRAGEHLLVEQQHDKATIATLKAQAVALHRDLAVDDAAVRLWRDAANAANAPRSTEEPARDAAAVPPASAAEGSQAGGSIVVVDQADLSEFVVNAAGAYRDCMTKLAGWIEFYNSLRSAK